MPLSSTGTDVTQRIVFNSGYLTIGGNRFVDLDNVAVETTFEEKPLRSLNSIKKRASKRSTLDVKLSGKVRSFNPEMLGYAFGSSSADGAGTLYQVKDGQLTNSLSPILTVYVDDNISKPMQYQLTGAFFTKLPITASTEDFGESDFEMVATDIATFVQG